MPTKLGIDLDDKQAEAKLEALAAKAEGLAKSFDVMGRAVQQAEAKIAGLKDDVADAEKALDKAGAAADRAGSKIAGMPSGIGSGSKPSPFAPAPTAADSRPYGPLQRHAQAAEDFRNWRQGGMVGERPRGVPERSERPPAPPPVPEASPVPRRRSESGRITSEDLAVLRGGPHVPSGPRLPPAPAGGGSSLVGIMGARALGMTAIGGAYALADIGLNREAYGAAGGPDAIAAREMVDARRKRYEDLGPGAAGFVAGKLGLAYDVFAQSGKREGDYMHDAFAWRQQQQRDADAKETLKARAETVRAAGAARGRSMEADAEIAGERAQRARIAKGVSSRDAESIVRDIDDGGDRGKLEREMADAIAERVESARTLRAIEEQGEAVARRRAASERERHATASSAAKELAEQEKVAADLAAKNLLVGDRAAEVSERIAAARERIAQHAETVRAIDDAEARNAAKLADADAARGKSMADFARMHAEAIAAAKSATATDQERARLLEQAAEAKSRELEQRERIRAFSEGEKRAAAEAVEKAQERLRTEAETVRLIEAGAAALKAANLTAKEREEIERRQVALQAEAADLAARRQKLGDAVVGGAVAAGIDRDFRRAGHAELLREAERATAAALDPKAGPMAREAAERRAGAANAGADAARAAKLAELEGIQAQQRDRAAQFRMVDGAGNAPESKPLQDAEKRAAAELRAMDEEETKSRIARVRSVTDAKVKAAEADKKLNREQLEEIKRVALAEEHHATKAIENAGKERAERRDAHAERMKQLQEVEAKQAEEDARALARAKRMKDATAQGVGEALGGGMPGPGRGRQTRPQAAFQRSAMERVAQARAAEALKRQREAGEFRRDRMGRVLKDARGRPVKARKLSADAALRKARADVRRDAQGGKIGADEWRAGQAAALRAGVGVRRGGAAGGLDEQLAAEAKAAGGFRDERAAGAAGAGADRGVAAALGENRKAVDAMANDQLDILQKVAKELAEDGLEKERMRQQLKALKDMMQTVIDERAAARNNAGAFAP